MKNLLEMKRVFVMSDGHQLIDIVDRRQAELDWREAQMLFCGLSAQWETTKEYHTMRELDVAESRLIQLFMNDDWHFSSTKEMKGKAWSAYRKVLLYHHARQS